jgi:hypothetical protein
MGKEVEVKIVRSKFSIDDVFFRMRVVSWSNNLILAGHL